MEHLNPGTRVRVISYPSNVPAPEGRVVWEMDGKVSIWLYHKGFIVVPREEVVEIDG